MNNEWENNLCETNQSSIRYNTFETSIYFKKPKSVPTKLKNWNYLWWVKKLESICWRYATYCLFFLLLETIKIVPEILCMEMAGMPVSQNDPSPIFQIWCNRTLKVFKIHAFFLYAVLALIFFVIWQHWAYEMRVDFWRGKCLTIKSTKFPSTWSNLKGKIEVASHKATFLGTRFAIKNYFLECTTFILHRKDEPVVT